MKAKTPNRIAKYLYERIQDYGDEGAATSNGDIAAALGLKERTIAKHRRRAGALLDDMLEQDEKDMAAAEEKHQAEQCAIHFIETASLQDRATEKHMLVAVEYLGNDPAVLLRRAVPPSPAHPNFSELVVEYKAGVYLRRVNRRAAKNKRKTAMPKTITDCGFMSTTQTPRFSTRGFVWHGHQYLSKRAAAFIYLAGYRRARASGNLKKAIAIRGQVPPIGLVSSEPGFYGTRTNGGRTKKTVGKRRGHYGFAIRRFPVEA